MSAPKSVTLEMTPELALLGDWEELVSLLRHYGGVVSSRALPLVADQIEAQLPKPKPAEPKGLGAVVKDRDGVRFVCVDPLHSLWRSEFSFMDIDYSAIDVVEVLSEGVPL